MFTFKKRSTGFFLLLCYDLLLIFFDIGLCHEYLNFFKAFTFSFRPVQPYLKKQVQLHWMKLSSVLSSYFICPESIS